MRKLSTRLLATMLLAVLSLCLSGCDGGPELGNGDTMAKLGEQTSIGVQGSVNFDLGSTILSISIQEIDDTRCPRDQYCIAIILPAFVTFKISPIDKVYRLCHQGWDTCESTANFSYKGKQYKLSLEDVTPYPTIDNVGAKKSVVFRLVEL